MSDADATILDEDAEPAAGEKAPRAEPAPLAHVVGILLGSPEFQRR
jgi:hypothetical protein